MFNLLAKIQTTRKRSQFLDLLNSSIGKPIHDLSYMPSYFKSIIDSLSINTNEAVTEQFIEQLKKELLQADIAQITVPIVPTEELISDMYSRLYPQGNGLLDIEVSSTLNSGVIVYMNGNLYNFTLEAQLKDLLEQPSYLKKIQEYL